MTVKMKMKRLIEKMKLSWMPEVKFDYIYIYIIYIYEDGLKSKFRFVITFLFFIVHTKIIHQIKA